MTLETLQKVRIVIPGILIFLAAIPLAKGNINLDNVSSSLALLTGTIYLVVIGTLGGIYYFLNLRSWASKESEKKIALNIKTRLLEPFRNDAEIMRSIDKVKRGSGILNVFYGFVDKDASLNTKAKIVYFNGAFWSTIADLRVISAFAYCIYLIAFLISQNMDFFWFS